MRKRFEVSALNQRLVDAIEIGDIAAVESAIENGADPNAIDTFGRPIFWRTIESFNGKMFQKLRTLGADLNIRSEWPINLSVFVFYLYSPFRAEELGFLNEQLGGFSQDILPNLLQTAILTGLEKVDVVLRLGADPNMPWKQATPLVVACSIRNGLDDKADIAKLLIDNGAEVNTFSTDNFYTPLRAAAETGPPELIRLLVSRGADLHDSFLPEDYFEGWVNGNTPLHCAAWQGKLNCCQTLVDLGAKINALSANRWTPLDDGIARARHADPRIAAESPEIVKYLRSVGGISVEFEESEVPE